MRMDPQLMTRVDASDVVQETQIVISKRINEFIQRRPTSFRLWIRRKVLEQLIDQRRRHLGAKKRSVLMERHMSDLSSIAIARNLLSNTPSKLLRRRELQEQIQVLIETLCDNDREMLSLRHAEGLENAEVAELLGIDSNTARQRYGRAVRRLHLLLAEHNITLDETGT